MALAAGRPIVDFRSPTSQLWPPPQWLRFSAATIREIGQAMRFDLLTLLFSSQDTSCRLLHGLGQLRCRYFTVTIGTCKWAAIPVCCFNRNVTPWGAGRPAQNRKRAQVRGGLRNARQPKIDPANFYPAIYECVALPRVNWPQVRNIVVNQVEFHLSTDATADDADGRRWDVIRGLTGKLGRGHFRPPVLFNLGEGHHGNPTRN